MVIVPLSFLNFLNNISLMLTYMASKIAFNHYLISLYQSTLVKTGVLKDQSGLIQTGPRTAKDQTSLSSFKKDEKTGLDWTSKHYSGVA